MTAQDTTIVTAFGNVYVFTDHDMRTARAAHDVMILASIDGEYDGPVTLCLSFGYVDLCLDGDLIAHGEIIVNVEDDRLE